MAGAVITVGAFRTAGTMPSRDELTLYVDHTAAAVAVLTAAQHAAQYEGNQAGFRTLGRAIVYIDAHHWPCVKWLALSTSGREGQA